MNYYMYYIRRVELLAQFALRLDGVLSPKFALKQLDEELYRAMQEDVITEQQFQKLHEKLLREIN